MKMKIVLTTSWKKKKVFVYILFYLKCNSFQVNITVYCIFDQISAENVLLK